jgi:hypothetical protein
MTPEQQRRAYEVALPYPGGTPDTTIIPVSDLATELRTAYPGARFYPTYQILRNRIYDGLIRSEVRGRRRFVPRTEVPNIAKLFGLDVADQHIELCQTVAAD